MSQDNTASTHQISKNTVKIFFNFKCIAICNLKFFYAVDGSEDSLIREEIPRVLDDSDDQTD